MKSLKAKLPVLLISVTIGLSATPAVYAAEVNTRDVFRADGYCHLKFPAIEEKTLGSPQPVLKDPGSGDIIDFYGPCNHDPLGKEEIHEQRLQWQHRWQRDYAS